MARTKSTVPQRTAQGLKTPRYYKRVSIAAKRSSAPITGGVKKPHRYRPGTVALREIRRYQRSTDLLIKKLPFARLVKQIAQEVRPVSSNNGENSCAFRFQALAIQAIQQAAEDFLVQFLEMTNKACMHRNCVTITPRDMDLVMELTQKNRPFGFYKKCGSDIGGQARRRTQSSIDTD